MSKKPPEPKPDADALPPFEVAAEQIQDIIDRVESGEATLADSLDAYARGMKLLKHCRGILDEAEKKIKTLNLAGEEIENEA